MTELEPNPSGKLFPMVHTVGAHPDWNPITLTSPFTSGHEVAEAQYLLSHNRWDEDYKPGKIDGVYGKKTAHATMQAKYWMGYKLHSASFGPVFGSKLRSYLLPRNHANARPLGPEDALRRAWRLKAYKRQQKDGVYINAYHIAMSQVGYQGSGPAGICSKYGTAFGLPCSNWCAEFVSWCINRAGGNFHQSFVPAIVQLAELRMGGLSIAPEPHRGCLVCYDWQSDGEWDHVEFFDEYLDAEHLSFMAVGGNTGQTNGQLGGQVLHQPRATSIKHVFINYRVQHPA